MKFYDSIQWAKNYDQIFFFLFEISHLNISLLPFNKTLKFSDFLQYLFCFPVFFFVGNFAQIFPSSASALKLIYPSVDNVRHSLEGYAAGLSLPYSSKVHAKQTWLLQFLHQWKSDRLGRSGKKKFQEFLTKKFVPGGNFSVFLWLYLWILTKFFCCFKKFEQSSYCLNSGVPKF